MQRKEDGRLQRCLRGLIVGSFRSIVVDVLHIIDFVQKRVELVDYFALLVADVHVMVSDQSTLDSLHRVALALEVLFDVRERLRSELQLEFRPVLLLNRLQLLAVEFDGDLLQPLGVHLFALLLVADGHEHLLFESLPQVVAETKAAQLETKHNKERQAADTHFVHVLLNGILRSIHVVRFGFDHHKRARRSDQVVVDGLIGSLLKEQEK